MIPGSFPIGIGGASQAIQLRFSHVYQQANGGALTVTVPAGVQSGDMLLFFDQAQNSVPSPAPTLVSPGASWTNLYNVGVNGTSNAIRSTGYYKLAAGTESGTNLGNMLGAGDAVVILLCFTTSVGLPFTTLTPSAVSSQAINGSAPTNQTIATGTLPYVAYASYTSVSKLVSPTFSPASDADIKDTLVGGPIMQVSYTIFNLSPSSETVTMGNGATNAMSSGSMTAT